MTRDRWYRWWDPKMMKISRHARHLSYIIGRRGAYLLFLALVDFLFGWSLFTVPGPVGLRPDLFLSYSEWAVFFTITGLICLWQAFVRVDRLAFALAGTVDILWGVVTTVSWALTATNPRGWVSGVIFIGFGVLTGIVSFWPEHHKIINGREPWDT